MQLYVTAKHGFEALTLSDVHSTAFFACGELLKSDNERAFVPCYGGKDWSAEAVDKKAIKAFF